MLLSATKCSISRKADVSERSAETRIRCTLSKIERNRRRQIYGTEIDGAVDFVFEIHSVVQGLAGDLHLGIVPQSSPCTALRRRHPCRRQLPSCVPCICISHCCAHSQTFAISTKRMDEPADSERSEHQLSQ